MSPWNTARIVRAAAGLVCPRTIAGAAISAAVAMPPLMTVRRANLVMSSSLIGGPSERWFGLPSLSHAPAGLATPLENEARAGLLVERPDRPGDARVGDLAVVAAERSVAVDIDHLLGDRTESRHEMVGRFHHHHLFLGRIDAEIGEELEAERLRAVGDQHDLDAADADGGAVAERYLGRAE